MADFYDNAEPPADWPPNPRRSSTQRDWNDPEWRPDNEDDADDFLCRYCQDRPRLDEGPYADLCEWCAFEAHKEDEGDRIRAERKESAR